MSIKEVKTSIADLKIGMFVSQLDRPWLETPYSLEGLLISSESEIQELAKYCSYVFVDLEQGISPKIRYWAVGNEDEMVLENKNSFIFSQDCSKEFKQYRQCVYETTIELKEELLAAKTVFKNVAEKTQRVFEALSKDKQLDLVALKPAVKATVDSIIRNPTAMSLLVQLRKSDDYNYTHALGTSVWCAQFGRHLGLKKQDINTLALGGLLLDVGKLKLPDTLISSPHQYNSNDLESVKQHVVLGLKILKQSAGNEQVLLEMVASHHERADGSGYQLGLTNKKIPLFGRLAGIVDSYDAMTSKRIHTESTFSPHEAMNELYKMRGKQFQAGLVEQFIQTVGLYPTGSLVELNTGEVAVVTEINDLKRLFPHVMVLLDKNKHPYDEFRTIDLSKVTGVKVVLGLESGAYGIKMEELFL
ncbi:MAG: DUF3391 domain-containing protein [Gammaproteobacteria bacterium]|nr:DUF3391 domain-containing protein [Gammaproteobacteria bacterium]